MAAPRALLLAALLAACTPVQQDAPAEAVAPAPPAPAQPIAPLPVAPIAPSPPQPVAVEPAKPLAAAKSFPKNVFAALSSGWDDHQWTVDIVDFPLAEGSELAQAIDALAAAHASSPAAEDGYFEHAELPAGHVAIPKGWKIGDTWTLMTRTGTLTRKVKGFAVTIPGGSGTYHFEVQLGRAPKGMTGPALAVRGQGDSPTLTVPEPVPLAVLGEGALAKIAAALPKKLEPEQRAMLRKHPLAEQHVAVFAGRFPGRRTHAIFVLVEPDGDEPAVSELLFAHDDGTIERFRIAEVYGRMKAFAIVDLDGDGLDEIAYEDEYHEGWYFELLHWKGDRPRSRTLTGDGI